jgi:CheY-like chemotaxis protein
MASVIVEVSDGVELLERVAENGPFALVVAHRALPALNGDQVLASVRTAGDLTPWLLLEPFCSDSVRSQLARLGNVALLEDPLDASELIRLSRVLLTEQEIAA